MSDIKKLEARLHNLETAFSAYVSSTQQLLPAYVYGEVSMIMHQLYDAGDNFDAFQEGEAVFIYDLEGLKDKE